MKDTLVFSLSCHHDRWKDISQDIRNKYKSFAIIRNPWARIVSRYIMGMPTYKWKDFEEFLETRYVWEHKEWYDPIRSWNTQYDYVCDENNNICCDILRLEDISIAKHNVGNYTKNYKDYYNSKSIQIIADWYAQDIDYWGFDFNTNAAKNYYGA
jgi:hypothetical protein